MPTFRINNTEFKVENRDKQLIINGLNSFTNIIKISSHQFKVVTTRKIFSATVIEKTDNKIILNINGHEINVLLVSRIGQILADLGMEMTTSKAVTEVKSPMPGAILEILVKENQEILKDTPLLILEAMKMENVIKCPVDTTIAKIDVSVGQSVEKNQVLLSFK